MGERTTFFKIDRQLLSEEFWLSEPFTKPQAWIDLIGRANYAEKTKYSGGEFIVVKRGQLPTSIRELEARWHWSKSKIRVFFASLERAGMITTERTAKGTLVTIENYAKYQGDYTTKSTAEDTEKERKRNADRTHNKKDKEREERKENITPPSEPEIDPDKMPTPPEVLREMAKCIGKRMPK